MRIQRFLHRVVSVTATPPAVSDWVQFGFSQFKSLTPKSPPDSSILSNGNLPERLAQDLQRLSKAHNTRQIQFVGLIGPHPICDGKIPTSLNMNPIVAAVYFRQSKLIVEHLGSARDSSQDIRTRLFKQKFTVTPGGASYRPLEGWIRRGAYSPTDFSPSTGIQARYIESLKMPPTSEISGYTDNIVSLLRPTWPSVTSGYDRLELLRNESVRGSTAIHTPFGLVPTVYMDLNAYGNPLKIADEASSIVRRFVGNTHGQSKYAQWSTQLLTAALGGIATHFGANLHHYDTLMRGVGFTGAFQSYLDHIRRAIPAICGDTVTFKDGAVAVSEIEHHSNSLPFLDWTQSVFQVPLKATGEVSWEKLAEFLKNQADENKPFIVISVSMQSNVTSLKTDISTLESVVTQFVSEQPSFKDRLFISLDLAAYAPHGDINLSTLFRDNERQTPLIDGIAFSPYKLDGGQQGVSVLMITKRLTGKSPVNKGGGSVEHVYDVTEKGVRWHSHDEEAIDLHNSGSPNVLGVFNTWLGIHFKEWIGTQTIHSVEKKYTQKAYSELHNYHTASSMITVLGPSLEQRGNTLPLVISFQEADEWFQTPPALVTLGLEQFFGITSRSGCNCAGPYGHALFGFSPSEMDKMDQHLLGFRDNRKSTMTRPGWSRVTLSPLLIDDEVNYFIDSVRLFARY
ncbi:aminotransferase class V-fold PLP-dependent enzyme, partial [bacterium]|nr:aminotransferase class V-fold PLP-dependent enzyme [bacterium]